MMTKALTKNLKQWLMSLQTLFFLFCSIILTVSLNVNHINFIISLICKSTSKCKNWQNIQAINWFAAWIIKYTVVKLCCYINISRIVFLSLSWGQQCMIHGSFHHWKSWHVSETTWLSVSQLVDVLEDRLLK